MPSLSNRIWFRCFESPTNLSKEIGVGLESGDSLIVGVNAQVDAHVVHGEWLTERTGFVYQHPAALA